MKKRHEQKLVLLAIGLLLLFNIPFVLSYSNPNLIFGIPVFYMVVFLICMVSIGISFYIIKKFHE
ncbi:MAG: hypothetical protein CMB99_12465 [Flavobacteriaceae bacterium]|nr:hypothetical protein [Flavobacteriaceae bacterium]